jgi:non-canonical (house-cleaning) NTP pyrophosphatase
MKIILASKSEQKIRGLMIAVDELGINADLSTITAVSGVHEQPEGDETLLGARNRAMAARTALPDAYAIGIENGLQKTADIAVVVIIAPDGKETIAESAPVFFPGEIIEEARRRGFDKVTAGKVLSEQCGSPHDDPQSYLTNGQINRAAMIAEAIKKALMEALS